MNEEEAKTKWCPFTHQRVMVTYDPMNYEQAVKAESRAHGCNCIASACMAWKVVGCEYTGKEIAVRAPNGSGRIEKETRDLGECGLVQKHSIPC